MFLNFRDQIRGLRSQHLKDMKRLKDLLANPSSLKVENVENSTLKPIGFATTWNKTKNGTPRQGVIAKMSTGFIDISKSKEFHPGLENPQYSLEGNILFEFYEIINTLTKI